MLKIDEGLDADYTQLWAGEGKLKDLGSMDGYPISTQSHETT